MAQGTIFLNLMVLFGQFNFFFAFKNKDCIFARSKIFGINH